MIYTGNKSVAASGTAVTLLSTYKTAAWVIVQAYNNNTGNVYIGDSSTSYDSAGTGKSYVGFPLAPGGSVTFPDIGGSWGYLLNETYIDADNADDGVAFIYGA